MTRPGRAGCDRARALEIAYDIVVSPDGRNVYVASFGTHSVAAFRRDASTGRLRQLPGRRRCVGRRHQCCAPGVLRRPIRLAISPSGHTLYAAGEHGIAVLSRRRDGSLRQPRGTIGCVSRSSGCTPGRGFSVVDGVPVSPDGRSLYAERRAALGVFRRRPDGSPRHLAGRRGCLTAQRHPRCAAVARLGGAIATAVSPDGRRVFLAASGVHMFARDRSTGALRELPSRCVAARAAAGCTRGRGASVRAPPSRDERSARVMPFRRWWVVFVRLIVASCGGGRRTLRTG